MSIGNRLTEEALEAQREIEDLRGALVRSQRELVRAKAKTDHLVAATIQAAHDAVSEANAEGWSWRAVWVRP